MAKKWLIKQNPILSPRFTLTDITFFSNDEVFNYFKIGNYGSDPSVCLLYSGFPIVAYNISGWTDENYRTVEFENEPSGILLTWLQKNATPITDIRDLTGYTWIATDTYTSGTSTTSNYNLNFTYNNVSYNDCSIYWSENGNGLNYGGGFVDIGESILITGGDAATSTQLIEDLHAIGVLIPPPDYWTCTVSGLGSSSASSVQFTHVGTMPTFEEITIDSNVFIKIPTMYRKVNTVSDGQITSFTISSKKIDNTYYPYTCFVDPSGYTIPYILIGKYWSDGAESMRSVSNSRPTEYLISEARTYARSCGDNYLLYDWQIHKLWQDLIICKKNSINTNSGTAWTTDELGIYWGTTKGWIDGIFIGSSYWYTSYNPHKYADGNSGSTMTYEARATKPSMEGCISKLSYSVENPFVNLPTAVSGSNYQNYYCDCYISDDGNHPVYSNVGGGDAENGAFACGVDDTWSSSNAGRLCYRADAPTMFDLTSLNLAIGRHSIQAIASDPECLDSLFSNTLLYLIKDKKNYFSIENASDSLNTISFRTNGVLTTEPVLEYTFDKFNWLSYTIGSSIGLNAGEKIYFRGNNSSFSESDSKYIYIDTDYAYNISGNIMSLLDKTCQSLTIPSAYCFKSLFSESKLASVTGLTLPATSLAVYCYDHMFAGCEQLIGVPSLPASILVEGCYANMFSDCEAITAAPLLAAESLAPYCYSEMFRGCSSLEEAPLLPATTLTSHCYTSMFRGCESLTLPQSFTLSASVLTTYCYAHMFENSGVTTVPSLLSLNLATHCYDHMFAGCVDLEQIPFLPAQTLTSGCYLSMFASCSKIKISETMTELYQTEYEFGTSTGLQAVSTDMFVDTGGTFVGTPNKILYYTSNELIGCVQLDTPVISLTENILHLLSVEYCTQFDIYVDQVLGATINKTGDVTDYNINDLHMTDGIHMLSCKAKAPGYKASNMSVSVSYTVIPSIELDTFEIDPTTTRLIFVYDAQPLAYTGPITYSNEGSVVCGTKIKFDAAPEDEDDYDIYSLDSDLPTSYINRNTMYIWGDNYKVIYNNQTYTADSTITYDNAVTVTLVNNNTIDIHYGEGN